MMSSSDGGGQDFDLNLAPIIDCFTVLITYLLVSASFISLCAFDVGVAATGEAPPAAADTPKDPPYSLMLTVQANEGIEIKLTGGPQNINTVIPIAAKGGGQDLPAFVKALKDLRTRYAAVKDATVNGEPTVKYKEIMRVIESLKSVYPKVYVGG